MRPFTSRYLGPVGLRLKRPRNARAFGKVLVVASALLLLFLAWPYATLWRMDLAVRGDDPAALVDYMDLDLVRAEIKQKLNKNGNSSIDELSDSFIRWLEEGIGVMGNEAVEQLVTAPWVRARLLDHSAGDGSEGFLGQVTYAFFDAPDGFVARIGPASGTPVQLRLSLRGLHWRISAVYY